MEIILGLALAFLFALGAFVLGYYLGLHAGMDTVWTALEVAMGDLPKDQQAALARAVLAIFAGIKSKYTLDNLLRRADELEKP